MKFIVSSSLLYKEIQTLGGVINSTNTLPILDNFLFEINNNKLTLSSSDLESTMTSEIEIESTSTDKIAISAKLLTDILKTFSEQPLTFSKTDNNTIEILSLIHISEPTRLRRISYAVFCLKKKKTRPSKQR